jgi:hypothetical protein
MTPPAQRRITQTRDIDPTIQRIEAPLRYKTRWQIGVARTTARSGRRGRPSVEDEDRARIRSYGGPVYVEVGDATRHQRLAGTPKASNRSTLIQLSRNWVGYGNQRMRSQTLTGHPIRCSPAFRASRAARAEAPRDLWRLSGIVPTERSSSSRSATLAVRVSETPLFIPTHRATNLERLCPNGGSVT